MRLRMARACANSYRDLVLSERDTRNVNGAHGLCSHLNTGFNAVSEIEVSFGVFYVISYLHKGFRGQQSVDKHVFDRLG